MFKTAPLQQLYVLTVNSLQLKHTTDTVCCVDATCDTSTTSVSGEKILVL